MTGSSRLRRPGRACAVVLTVPLLTAACTSGPSRDEPIDAFPGGSPTAAPEVPAVASTPSPEVGTAFEVPDVVIRVPGAEGRRAVEVSREVRPRARQRAGFLLREQLLRVRLDGSAERPGAFRVAPPTTELPDRLVLDRWLGGPDGYLVCLYDNRTGQWALGTGYVRGGTSFAEVTVGDDFQRRCL